MDVKNLIKNECINLLKEEAIQFIVEWLNTTRGNISKEQERLVDQEILRGACLYRHPPYNILYNNIDIIRKGIPILDFEDCRLIISIILEDGLYIEYNNARVKLKV